MQHEDFDAVIVGAGIAGCVAALVLGLAGHRVLVTERAAEFGRVGPDFIKPRGIEILRELGVDAALRRRGAIPRSTIRYYHDGAPLLDYDFAEHTAAGHYLITPYHVLLDTVVERLAALPNVQIWFSSAVRALTPVEDRARVETEAGRSATARVVIGADGANSRVRALAGIAAERHSYAQIMFLATMPLVASVAECNRLYLTSERRAAYFYPLDGESMRVTTVVAASDAQRFREDVAWVRAYLRRFVSESDDVLDAIRDTSIFHGMPLGHMHADAYHRGNVALIGNAILEVHPMTGQGMSLALEDARALAPKLSACFRGELTLHEALARYEAERRPLNEALLQYGDRLYRSFPSRAAYLENFDPRMHGELHKQART